MGSSSAVRTGFPPPAHPSEKGIAFSAVFALILLGLVTFALSLAAPGVAILLAVLATPVLVWFLVGASRRGSLHWPAGTGASIITALALVVAVGIASVVAFLTACFAVCFGGVALSDKGNVPGSEGSILACSLSSGFAAALVVAIFLFRKLWPRG
jgi:hypothetical protein